MSRWGKNIVVPLDSLCKEKENTNRPTVARSVGTVGKWGKMGFTSTRTYALAALPATLSAASPGESPSSALDFDMSPSVPEPPKPKKFFKSINTTTTEVIAQIIQHIPRVTPNSPMRDTHSSHSYANASQPSPQASRAVDAIKKKIPKKTEKAECKKKKVATKTAKVARTPSIKSADEHMSDASADNNSARVVEVKSIKKKKELKPEAPPSRVLGRARKTVNYCEEDEEERILVTSLKDIALLKDTKDATSAVEAQSLEESIEITSPILSPTVSAIATAPTTTTTTVNTTAKASEHKPIVLRISKGTSRLVDTDNDDDTPTASPPHDISCSSNNTHISLAANNSGSSIEETDINAPQKLLEETQIINKTVDLLRPPAAPAPATVTAPVILDDFVDNGNEINYSSVKISPDKPPKERLKLIIKTDVIRNAIAAAAAAAAAANTDKESNSLIENPNKNNNNNNSSSNNAAFVNENQQQQLQRTEKEKKKGKHKHKSKQQQQHSAGVIGTTLTPQICEFKAPSPNIISNNSSSIIHTNGGSETKLTPARTVISPAVLSERDFDSQSSVLGSISSKGNSTPQLIANTGGVQEDCYVVHSRGSSVITSDLETSQHSSLVAPPSDIELRLESMMMDGSDTGGASQAATSGADEPLQEDILSVLRGDEDNSQIAVTVPYLTNGESSEAESKLKQRGKRGRGRTASKRALNLESENVVVKVEQKTKRLRKRKFETPTVAVEEEKTTTIPPASTNRRGRPAKKIEETTDIFATSATAIPTAASTKDNLDKSKQEDVLPSNTTTPITAAATTAHTTDIQEETTSGSALISRRGRPTRSTRNNSCNYNNNNNSNNNNNNNINKIAANLCARAEAQNTEAAAATITTTTSNNMPTAISTPRSYGRKRKNQQVMKVLQPPTADELGEEEEQQEPNSAKISAMSCNDNLQNPTASNAQITNVASSTNNPNINSNNNSSNCTSPPRHDYKVKDKFKRTIMLDNNPGSCDAVIAMTNYEQQQQQQQQEHDSAGSGGEEQHQEQQQRAAVKLVISKKKGSIFKSRTLVPSDQSTEVTKRHLYKHSWDHDSAGGHSTRSDDHTLDNNSVSVSSNTLNAANEMYDDDFDDDDDDNIDDNDHQTRANVDGGGNSNAMEINATSSSSSGPATGGGGNNNVAANSAFNMDVDELSRNSASNADGSAVSGSKRKDFYTVVRNVKTAHEIQEIGEYQEMNDDVQYILDALQPHNPMSTRILSALQLASKCMNSAFRMHVRSHDVVTKFFKALSDAKKDLSLGLCTSAVMYILSQEGLNMDLDRDSLELMMNLLEAETVAAPADHATYERNQLKVRELCEEIKAQGKATHLNVDTITVGTLAMETLLSLTSKRAGDWFKEELRELGGLEHILKTITDCCRPVIRLFEVMPAITWTGALLDSMKTVERCMRVLENVTQMNEENQKYILKYEDGAMVNTLATLYRLCERELLRNRTTEITEKDNTGVVLRELLMPLMKVLINLTHSFRKNSTPGAEVLGKRTDVFDTSFNLLLKTSNYIPERLGFELNILVLLLLINLTMYSKINRARVIQAQAPIPTADNDSQGVSTVSAVQAIMQYFYKCEELARLVEKNTDAMLDNTDKDKKKQEEVDETVNNLIQKAGHHMEHTLKGSYAGIFIGHIISDNDENEIIVRRYLHGNGFKKIINVLEKYYTFMNLTASSDAFTVAHIKSTKELIDYYKRRDLIYAAIGDENLPLNLDTSSSSIYDNNMASTSSAASAAATTSSTRGSTQRVYKTYSSQR